MDIYSWQSPYLTPYNQYVVSNIHPSSLWTTLEHPIFEINEYSSITKIYEGGLYVMILDSFSYKFLSKSKSWLNNKAIRLISIYKDINLQL